METNNLGLHFTLYPGQVVYEIEGGISSSYSSSWLRRRLSLLPVLLFERVLSLDLLDLCES